MKDVIFTDKKYFELNKRKFVEDGAEKFHVLADFDRTLTKSFVDGKKTPSIISELRRGNYISKEYAEKVQTLADKYHPIEIDPNISFKEKKKAMNEWWSKHFNLLIKSGLNKKHLERIISEGKIQFRKGVPEFLDFLYGNGIPLVILSSAV